MAHVRTAQALEAGRQDGGTQSGTLIGYLPLGFPNLQASVDAAKAIIEAGVGVVELGLPYSDPVMDGPVIQSAVQRALDGGFRVRDALIAVEQVAALGAPVLVMSYWNPILRYGVDAWARDLAAAGGAGMITPDLIPDEGTDWIEASETHDLDRVFLVAPSSTPERLALTAAACRGFVYAASTMGVTGTRASVGVDARRLVADTRAAGGQEVCVGLGVSTPDQVREISEYADGVIVGSALVRALDPGTDAGASEISRGISAVADAAAHLALGLRPASNEGSLR